MKKQILNIGKALSKAEQRRINGGYMLECTSDEDCNLEEDSYCNTARGFCVNPNSYIDPFGCDPNPYTNPYRIGCP